MDIETRKATALKLYNDLTDTMANLAARWADEGQFEDINDYRKVLEPYVTAVGGQIIKMTKRPFGFHYTLGGATYMMAMRARNYEYKRL